MEHELSFGCIFSYVHRFIARITKTSFYEHWGIISDIHHSYLLVFLREHQIKAIKMNNIKINLCVFIMVLVYDMYKYDWEMQTDYT